MMKTFLRTLLLLACSISAVKAGGVEDSLRRHVQYLADDARKGRGWYMAAAFMQLIVYSIPHSVVGSELDYTKQG